jgi:hypothetical protein
MILRRLVAHLKDQHWTGVFIELVIVVLGVFIGMQVSNWNADRGERAAEIGYLGGLEEDVDYSTGSLQRFIRNLETQQTARTRLYDYATDPKSTLEPAERDRLVLDGLFELPQLDINEVTFETLKSSGRLSAIRSPKLVSELQSLSANVAAALRDQADEVQTTYLFSDPLLVANMDMAGVFRQQSRSGNPYIPWLKDAPHDAPTPEIMKSRQFANVLLYRSFFTNLRLKNARNMLEQHQRIAALIKARQDQLRGTP